MTYIEINFPEHYGEDNKIFLKDIISEKDGIKFCISLMKSILDIQIEGNEKPDIAIMSQVYVPVKQNDSRIEKYRLHKNEVTIIDKKCGSDNEKTK
jgi:hypothetical protein